MGLGKLPEQRPHRREPVELGDGLCLFILLPGTAGRFLAPPRSSWYRQFAGTNQDRPPELNKTIRPVTSATLTAHATTEAIRKVLALHRVLQQ
ncbi:MAG: hypothetical protein ACUVRY_01700 [Thermoanaerobaculaceae bacterium]